MSEKKQKLSCESTVCCKATAELQEEIKEDMEKTDASLKELIENDDKRKNEVPDNR